MRRRIITDGNTYRVQERGWLWWMTVGYEMGGMGMHDAAVWYPYDFPTLEAAQEFVRGCRDEKRAHPWRVVEALPSPAQEVKRGAYQEVRNG